MRPKYILKELGDDGQPKPDGARIGLWYNPKERELLICCATGDAVAAAHVLQHFNATQHRLQHYGGKHRLLVRLPDGQRAWRDGLYSLQDSGDWLTVKVKRLGRLCY